MVTHNGDKTPRLYATVGYVLFPANALLARVVEIVEMERVRCVAESQNFCTLDRSSVGLHVDLET